MTKSSRDGKPSAVELQELLDRSRADAKRSHGLRILDLRGGGVPPSNHLPGSAWLALGEGELPHPSLLGRRGAEILVMHEEIDVAKTTAAALCGRGLAARYVVELPPDDQLVDGAPSGALWSPDPYLTENLALLTDSDPKEVLDLGCGSGRDAVFLAQQGCPVVGVERLPDALDLARARAAHHRVHIEWITRRVRTIEDLPDRSFSAVLCVRFWPGSLLPELHQVVRGGGRLLVHTYARAAFQTQGAQPRSHLGSATELRQTMSDAWEFERGPEERQFEGIPWVEAIARRKGSP